MRDGPIFFVDAESGVGLQQQIREKLIHAILSGVIEPGSRLPSSRGLAKKLGVGRNTVMLVYHQLIADGYLRGKERSGIFVCEDLAEIASARNAPDEPALEGGGAAWRSLMKRRMRVDWSRRVPPDWRLHPYPFLDGCFDGELASLTEWREAARLALSPKDFSSWALDFSELDDEKLVHEVRTKVLPRRGVQVSADEILITEGRKQALDLIVQLFIDRKSRVVIEDPCLPEIRELLRLQNAEVIVQPLDREGLILDGRIDGAQLSFVTPSRHAPTGVQMSRTRQKALLRKTAQEGGVIVELDISLIGAGAAKLGPALKSMDVGDRVIYVGDLCEMFGPGLRLGFIVAPSGAIREMRKARALMSGPAARAAQRIGALLLSLGHYDAILGRLRRSLSERMLALRDALNYHLPRLVLIDPKLTGASIWVNGPPGLNARLLAREAAKRGILIEPAGGFFASEGAGDSSFRMGVASLPIEKIRPGVAALAAVMQELTDPALDKLDLERGHWLKAKQLETIMSGATLLCRTAYGDPYSVEICPDGSLIGKAGYAHEDCDEGQWWIEGDRWCRRWNSWSYGETARYYTVVDGDHVKWYKDDLILFNRGVIARSGRVALEPKEGPEPLRQGRPL